ncbi:proteinase-activated receptor 3 isoform X1 [Hippocampus comes]|uniref:Coagulation factor II thrombin receptor like 2 n=1 Tax=Hippocampus comes TaxID=109280 RepID=A0A3Q2Y324_HIPCM|nr:PREDICTED: proteinase-activated receptor 3-like isoform X1 [Hippocampus comes]
MADILVGLIICLMAVQTIQADGNRTRTPNSTQPEVCPKSFKGKLYQRNLTKQQLAVRPSGDPWLDVDPDDAATAYATGLLSTWILPIAYILAMIVGIPSNAYILAFLRLRLQAKSLSTVVLYLNLALSDLLLLLSLALRIHYHFSGNNWVFGEISCRLMTALFYGNVYCSAQTIACISLKRYLAVVKPFLYRRLAKTVLAVWACLIVWFLFGAAIVPELLVRQSYWLAELGVTTCHDVLPLEEKPHSLLVPYRLMLVFLGFVIPFLISIYAHVSVVHHLGQSGCNWRPFIKISTLVFIIFVVCFLPSGILHIAHYARLLSSGDDKLYGYYRCAVCLCCFHSCLDPFLCLLISKSAASEIQFISIRRIPERLAVKICD